VSFVDRETLKSLRELVNTVGFPIVVAVALFLVLVGIIPSPLTRIGALEDALERHRRADRERTRLERHICRSLAILAKTDLAKCDPNGGE
jgi:hypothetical protein